MILSDDLVWRGLIKDKTFDDNKWLDKPQAFYLGIDASAPSMTVGNLAIILMARRLAEARWKTVLLMGGGTSLVGDPGGKAEERQLKSREEIQNNIAAVRQQVTKLFQGAKYEMVDNHDWLADLKYLDFLRDVGKHFSMTELMQREFVGARMGEHGSGLSYAEFSYSLIQGYDYWHLFNEYKTVLQIGGSDQWGNMLSGVALIRKKENQEVQAMSMPLVVDKKTGAKFGKSEAGAVWLDPAQTSPTQFYQFWMNASDDDVEDYLKIFTFLSKSEIEQVMAEQAKDPAKRPAQTTLAKAVTELVHGSGGGESSEAVTKYLTSQVSIAEASDEELSQIRSQIPNIKANAGDLVVEALAKSGLASSNSDARRLLSSGAIYLNNQPTNKEKLEESDFHNGKLLLRRGKAYKDSALIELA